MADNFTCDKCGRAIVDPWGVYYGYCVGCLQDRCTYDVALEYLKAHDCVASFFFWLLNDGNEPARITGDLEALFYDIYLRRKAEDLILQKDNFLKSVREYILVSDNDTGKYDFARFLKAREKNA